MMVKVTNDNVSAPAQNAAVNFPAFVQQNKDTWETETRFGLKRQDIRDMIRITTGKWGNDPITREQVGTIANQLSDKTGYEAKEFLPEDDHYKKGSSWPVPAMGSGPETKGAGAHNRIQFTTKKDPDTIEAERFVNCLFAKFASAEAIAKMKKKKSITPHPDVTKGRQ